MNIIFRARWVFWYIVALAGAIDRFGPASGEGIASVEEYQWVIGFLKKRGFPGLPF